MYQRLLGDAAFYRLLLHFDEELAATERPKGCRVCGKRLEVSDFPRKPRGFGLDLGERFAERLSFCCADRTCRKRRTPPYRLAMAQVAERAVAGDAVLARPERDVGWGLLIGVLLLTLAIVLWLLSDLVRLAPRRLGGISGIISAGCLVGAYLSYRFFYIPPVLCFSATCVILLAAAAQLLRHELGASP
ncbi:MAG: hypothetical protein WAU49_16685 [Steroidobacteraceae bacterium]